MCRGWLVGDVIIVVNVEVPGHGPAGHPAGTVLERFKFFVCARFISYTVIDNKHAPCSDNAPPALRTGMLTLKRRPVCT